MASGKDLIGTKSARMLIVGYPGGGKTGGLASLANVGYKIRILDFEGNYAPLLYNTKPEFLHNIEIKTLQDKLAMGSKFIEPVGIPTAFKEGLEAMKSWKVKDSNGNVIEDLGNPSDWGNDTIVVVDSLTSMSEAAMDRATKLMNKGPGTITSAVWGAAVNDVRNMIKLMARDDNKYHLIVLGHLQMISSEDFIKQGDSPEIKETKMEAIKDDLIPTKLFPTAVTKNQSMKIAKELSTMITAKKIKKHGKTMRVLETTAGEELDLKFPANAPDSVPLETGLAQLFEILGYTPPIST